MLLLFYRPGNRIALSQTHQNWAAFWIEILTAWLAVSKFDFCKCHTLDIKALLLVKQGGQNSKSIELSAHC